MTDLALCREIAEKVGFTWSKVSRDAVTIQGDTYLLDDTRDLDAFVKAVEGTLTIDQKRAYGDELSEYAWKDVGENTMNDDEQQYYWYLIATAPTSVRLSALKEVVGCARA